jgi:hypothetical protein
MTKKTHTKEKRKAGLSSGHKHSGYLGSKVAKHGARTFKTAEQAKQWMQLNKQEAAKFKIVASKHGKRFGIKPIL